MGTSGQSDLWLDASDAGHLVSVLAALDVDVERRWKAHLVDFDGEPLPTVFLGELARSWIHRDDAVRLFSAINGLLCIGSDPLRNVLLTGFVEGLPHDLDQSLVDLMPEPLRSEVTADLAREG